jgi:hypothetical protein
MATAVASRFSVLSLDVEDDVGRGKKADRKKVSGEQSAPSKDGKNKATSQSKQQDAKKKTNNKKKTENNVSSFLLLYFTG